LLRSHIIAATYSLFKEIELIPAVSLLTETFSVLAALVEMLDGEININVP